MVLVWIPFNFENNTFQLWSSKWSIKDEHKLLSELGGAGTTTGQTGGYYDPHGGFSGVTGVTSAADIYDTINTMSQTGQNLYTPPLAGSLGRQMMPIIVEFGQILVVGCDLFNFK